MRIVMISVAPMAFWMKRFGTAYKRDPFDKGQPLDFMVDMHKNSPFGVTLHVVPETPRFDALRRSHRMSWKVNTPCRHRA